MSDARVSAPWDVAPDRWPRQDLVGFGGSLAPDRLVAAYRHGVFPMPVGEGPVGWWSPTVRAIMLPARLRVTRSMRQSAKRNTVTVDVACADVIDACGDPRRPGGWIDDRIRTAYNDLHADGLVHSVEVWRDGQLAGGLYGLGIGGLFAGESMFSVQRDASKVALMALVDVLDTGSADWLLDVQWLTPHLESLGAIEVSRRAYLRRLRAALDHPAPVWKPTG